MSPASHQVRGFPWIAAALVLVFATGVFAASTRERAPLLGLTPIGMGGWTTAGSALVARHWVREGAWRLRFVMYWEADSVEHAHPTDRKPYLSYPPGTVVPIYLLARALRVEPNPLLVMRYNLAIHWAVACLLAMTALVCLWRLGVGQLASGALSAIPPAMYVYLPGPYHEHQMAYFADQAVMLPFAIYLFLAVLASEGVSDRSRRAFRGAMALCAFWGVLTDWLFLFVLVVHWALRLAQREWDAHWLRGSIAHWTPAAAALCLFLLQLAYLGAFDVLWDRFEYRTGIAQRPGLFAAFETTPATIREMAFSFGWDNRFWQGHIPAAYHNAGRAVLIGLLAAVGMMLAAAAWRRRRNGPPLPGMPSAYAAALLAVLPCFLHYHVFKAHSAFLFHFFATLKFALPLALLPWAILPGIGWAARPMRGNSETLRGVLGGAAVGGLLVLAGAYLLVQNEMRRDMFAAPDMDFAPMHAFIGAHTGYEDVVFSMNHEVPAQPPQFMLLTNNRVYRVENLDGIHAIVADIDAPFYVTLFSNGPETHDAAPGLAALAEAATEVVVEGDWRLRRIPRRAYEAVRAEQERME